MGGNLSSPAPGLEGVAGPFVQVSFRDHLAWFGLDLGNIVLLGQILEKVRREHEPARKRTFCWPTEAQIPLQLFPLSQETPPFGPKPRPFFHKLLPPFKIPPAVLNLDVHLYNSASPGPGNSEDRPCFLYGQSSTYDHL